VLTAFGRAFRTPDLRKKLLFTLFVIALYRLGTTIPGPGVDFVSIQACLKKNDDNSLYALVNLFSGGALLKLSVFALGIMPYITSSIILQLLTVVIPRLEDLKNEGQSGQAKITQYTRYLTIALAVLQATGIIALARSGRLLQGCDDPIIADTSYHRIIVLVLVMTAGTGVIMWLGELVTDRGVGNGMSVLIFTSIISSVPSQGGRILRQDNGGYILAAVLALILVVITLVVFVEQAQRRIPVQYAKRQIGRRQYGGTSTYIPLKVNQAGVIPVIFASSLLYLPQLASNVSDNASLIRFTSRFLDTGGWEYLLTYFALVLFFTYFYVAITFNPVEVSDNMKKYGGFVPGIRPGRATAEYLDYILSRITAFGALYLGAVAVLPYLLFSFSSDAASQTPFGGTAVLIIVGVGLETVKQVESQLMLRRYEGFLR
jgi:preprotein translocase subunit SecY